MLDKKQVQHIAGLARLELSDQEIDKMQRDLAAILEHFKTLKEVDTTNVDPFFYPAPLENIMRKDETSPQKPETVEQMLDQAPAKQDRQIKVKEVLYV